MTSNEFSTSNRSIARRTMIGLLGSGMATLAGCFGSGGDENSDSDDEEPDESTETASSPEERSQYIESTEIVAGDNTDLLLEISVVDSYDWDDIQLLTESGENYSMGRFDEGETLTRVPLTQGDDTFEPIPPGEHTLLLNAIDLETEVPFTLSTQMGLAEAVSGSNREELNEGDLGLVFQNTGSHADATALTVNGDIEDELELTPIPPGEIGLAVVNYVLSDDSVQCDNNEGVREQEYTVEFLWSESLKVSVPIEYNASSTDWCERSLVGSATVTTAEGGTET